MTFLQYLVEVQRTKQLFPEWRAGQTAFNVLRRVKPDLAERVRGTDFDPFYRDKVLHDFYKFVSVEWDSNGLST